MAETKLKSLLRKEAHNLFKYPVVVGISVHDNNEIHVDLREANSDVPDKITVEGQDFPVITEVTGAIEPYMVVESEFDYLLREEVEKILFKPGMLSSHYKDDKLYFNLTHIVSGIPDKVTVKGTDIPVIIEADGKLLKKITIISSDLRVSFTAEIFRSLSSVQSLVVTKFSPQTDRISDYILDDLNITETDTEIIIKATRCRTNGIFTIVAFVHASDDNCDYSFMDVFKHYDDPILAYNDYYYLNTPCSQLKAEGLDVYIITGC